MYTGGTALSSSNLAQKSLLSPSSSTRQDVVQGSPVLYKSECFPSLTGLGSGGVSSILSGSSIHLVPSLNQQLELAKPSFSGFSHPDCSSILSGIPNNVQPFTNGEFGPTSNISSALSSHPIRSNIDDACLTGNRKKIEVIQDGINGNGNGFPIVDLDYLLFSGCNQTQKASASLPAAEIQTARTIAGENVDLFGTMNNPSILMTGNYDQLLDENNVNKVFMQHVNCEIPMKHLVRKIVL